jgi:hypothetical protein
MATERTRRLLLGAVVIALALTAYQIWPWTSGGAAPASNERTAARPARSAGSTTSPSGAGTPAPEVRLDALDGQRPKPIDAERDLFRFKPKAAPPARLTPQPADSAPAPVGPPPVAPLPPIALKFIGIVQQGDQSPRIALLSDGRHLPFYGREGDIIEGRYKILRIGVESIDIAYIDGRGRQTIRLTGS